MSGRRFSVRVADGPLPRTGAQKLAAGSGPSAGKTGDLMVDFVRSEEAEAATGAVVEFGRDGGALTLGEGGEVSAFGEVLSEKSVGVFVGTAFPGVVRSGEVEFGVEVSLERFVQVELRAVIRGDSSDRMRFVAQDVDSPVGGLLSADTRKLAEAQKAALTFDDRDGGGLAAAVEGVDLPVTEARSARDDGRALGDHFLAGEAAAAVVATVAFPAPLVRTAEAVPERSPFGLILPDVEVDGLMTHRAHAFEAESADNLRRTIAFAQHAFDRDEVLRRVAAITPGAAAAAVGLLDCEHRSVRPIVAGAVSFDLTADRGAIPLELPCDLRGSVTAGSHRCDGVSFFTAQLPVAHRHGLLHLLPESKEPNKAPEPTLVSVTPPANVPKSE